MISSWMLFFYLLASICFVLALRGLAAPSLAVKGNKFGMLGMGIAIAVSLIAVDVVSWWRYLWVILAIASGGFVGIYIAKNLKMTALPQLIAGFHSLVGMSAVMIALIALFEPQVFNIGQIGGIKISNLLEMSLGAAIGAVTFSGSLIAFLKLHGIIAGKPLRFVLQHKLNLTLAMLLLAIMGIFILTESYICFFVILILAFTLGFLLILPIGGADMPVVISMLNSYSGWAAAGIGFTLGNTLLIIVGALVGASGAILSYIMCKAMNRSIINVIFAGAFGKGDNKEAMNALDEDSGKSVKIGSPEEAAFIMENAETVIIVPGYGMAVAAAQHALAEMAALLRAKKVKVKYAIHPVAGRMPGHMNVLLAEAGIPYEDVFELDDINHEFAVADVAYVIGANDVTNPLAKTDSSSPIYGMPILEVAKAKTVFFVKRSMASGYAGIENPLFFADNTIMLFGDAKKVTEEVVKDLQEE